MELLFNIIQKIIGLFLNSEKITEPNKDPEKVVTINNKQDKINWLFNYYKKNKLPIDEINLIGIRDYSNIEKDKINDYLGYFTKDKIFLCKGTTHPGVYYTKEKNVLHEDGAFHLLEGFHKKIWCVGTHNNYEALVNDWRYCLPTEGHRDSNFNFEIDEEDIKVKGYFGINFHRMHSRLIEKVIGRYSAGCQVVQDPKDFKHIMSTIKNTNMYLNNSQKTVFNYMLFTINQMPNNFIK